MDADGFDLTSAHIAIVGLGLMGGSLAMALKGKCAELYGVSPTPATLETALRLGIVSQAAAGPAAILPRADVIVLAAPLPAILDLLAQLPELVPQPCIILDLGSSKEEILSAMATLPERFDPIGGHPSCGKERLSLANAEAGLYQDAPFVLTPLERTTTQARSCAQKIVAAVGARSVWLDAAAHDAGIAATSHLPYLVASALALATPCVPEALLGPGFRSTSRLAATPSAMMLGVLQSNRTNLLAALARFRSRLDALEAALIAEDADMLQSLLDQSASRRSELVP
jgi:prephenate dehydrogenase